MATYVIYGYSTDSLVFDSGSGSLWLDADFDYKTDRIKVEITDDDDFFDGDNGTAPVSDEIGNDVNQVATVTYPDGTVVGPAQVYIEGYYTATAGGSTEYVDEIEIDGILVGYFSTFDMEPGEAYTTSSYTDMSEGGQLSYSSYSSVLCFDTHCPINTTQGAVPAGALSDRSLLMGRDGAVHRVQGLYRFDGNGTGNQRGIRIAKGALGFGLPRRDITVSWLHRILLPSAAAQLMFAEPEVLVPACALVGWPGIKVVRRPISFVHISTASHQLVGSAGIWSETALNTPKCLIPKRRRLHQPRSAIRPCLTLREARALAELHRSLLRKKRVA